MNIQEFYNRCIEEKIDPDAVVAFVDQLTEKAVEIHSFTIMRNNKVVLEAGWYPYDARRIHILNSVTKTVLSIALGMIYDEGLLDINKAVIDYFPELVTEAEDERLRALTIRHLLTMSLGQDDTSVLEHDSDWAKMTLNKYFSFDPGTVFFYNNSCSNLLSHLFTRLTGQSVARYLAPALFEKLGIEHYFWQHNLTGDAYGAVGLYLSSSDLAKIGQLLLNHGCWNNERLLSEDWVAMATGSQIQTAEGYAKNREENRQGYGFHIWRCTHNAYRASGLYGQMCLMIPDKNTVVAFNSSTEGSQSILDVFWDTCYRGILEEDASLLPHDASRERFCHLIGSLQIPPLAGEKDSPQADRISGKKMIFDENPFGFGWLQLTFAEDTVSVEFERKGELFAASYANKVWKQGVSNIDRLFPHTMQPKVQSWPAEYRPDAYGSFEWTTITTLKTELCFSDNTAHFIIQYIFDGERVRFDWMPMNFPGELPVISLHAKL